MWSSNAKRKRIDEINGNIFSKKFLTNLPECLRCAMPAEIFLEAYKLRKNCCAKKIQRAWKTFRGKKPVNQECPFLMIEPGSKNSLWKDTLNTVILEFSTATNEQIKYGFNSQSLRDYISSTGDIRNPLNPGLLFDYDQLVLVEKTASRGLEGPSLFSRPDIVNYLSTMKREIDEYNNAVELYSGTIIDMAEKFVYLQVCTIELFKTFYTFHNAWCRDEKEFRWKVGTQRQECTDALLKLGNSVLDHNLRQCIVNISKIVASNSLFTLIIENV